MSWLTPSEIFSPYYGGALAECILSHHLSSGSKSPLEVYELGAGTGTVARDILDYVKRHAPKVYGDMRYTTVEISSNLARLQHEKVGSLPTSRAACVIGVARISGVPSVH